jgi:ubiquinone/menaquinone biosynthesis C-methylase UbiE
MTEKNQEFEAAVLAAKEHTTSYATNPKYLKDWQGFTERAGNFKAQQLRTFARLVGSVTDTLSDWRILDVGCGDGHWLRTFLEFGAQPADLFGIDISSERFDYGRSKNPSITLMQTDGIKIPFEDAHFDLVTQFVAFSSIPTISLRQQVAQEIYRVLKPGGYVFWWDLLVTAAPSEKKKPLQPADYFDWQINKRMVGEMPLPSESLRPLRGLSKILAPVVDILKFPHTHMSALIGPKF